MGRIPPKPPHCNHQPNGEELVRGRCVCKHCGQLFDTLEVIERPEKKSVDWIPWKSLTPGRG